MLREEDLCKFVYMQSECTLWTVGFYDPDGYWHSESDHDTKDAAAHRCHWLNGGKNDQEEVISD